MTAACRRVQPQKVSAEELQVALGERTKPLIVDFYATWCGPCVLLAKELEMVRRPLPPRGHSCGCDALSSVRPSVPR